MSSISDKHSFELSDSEIDLILQSLKLFKRDLNFDLITFSRSGNLDAIQSIVNSLSTIEFIFSKIHF